MKPDPPTSNNDGILRKSGNSICTSYNDDIKKNQAAWIESRKAELRKCMKDEESSNMPSTSCSRRNPADSKEARAVVKDDAADNNGKADSKAPADNDDSTDTNTPADSDNSDNSDNSDDNADDSNNSDDSSSGNVKNPADSGTSDSTDESGNAARSPAKIPKSVINFCKTQPKGKNNEFASS